MTTKKAAAADPRSPAQREVDEAVMAGDWTGFETKSLLTEEGACELLRQRHSSNGTSELTGQPFRWRDRVFRILRCDYVGGEAIVEVAPHDDEFVAEIKRRVEQDRFHTLTYYQGFGFVSFPEDYQKYQS